MLDALAKEKKALLFHGLSAFPITPADDNGRIEVDPLCRLLDRLSHAGVDSVGLLGSTGSYMYLARAERRRAMEAATECLGGRVPMIVSVGALRTDDAQELARDAQAAGADGLLLAPVSYTPLTDEEVFQHYSAVAGATDLPMCVYNNPGTTHFSIGNALLERLASVPNIVAVKNPAQPLPEMWATHEMLKAALPSDFAIGYSGDWNAPAALLAGGAAWYSVVAGLLPEPSLKLTRAAEAGDTAEVERIDGCFAPLWALFKELSSYRVVHAAANAMGLTNTRPPRPILPLTTADQERIIAAVHALDQV
ncbi:MAG: dihydrodipicolinate synthase family protein [Phyllobacterium sp.]|uniref:dihydrodipicolinate synthase family protein n=1 Tax=Phyllobacterium sp. TaxID=1871046 RepID=UPI0030F237BE